LCLTLEQELTPFDFDTEMERSNCVIRKLCDADSWQSANSS
jgi:hypothetical protein